MKLRLGILASGKGSNLQAIVDACESGQINAHVEIVISDVASAFALERAKKHHIPAFHLNPQSFPTKDLFEQRIVELLREHEVDLVCLAGFMRIIGKTLLKAFPQRILNIHPALLPSFPGRDAVQQAIDYGAKVSGCTIHIVDEKADHGPIVRQRAVLVDDSETAETLTAKIQREEHRLYPYAISLFAEGRIQIEGRRARIISATRGAP